MSPAELDRNIEDWLESQWRCTIDFEISAALNKLIALELIEEGDGCFTAVPLHENIHRLDRRWDDYFVASKPA